MQDSTKSRGQVTIRLIDEHGKVKECIRKNLTTTLGLQVCAERISGAASPRGISHMAVGTGNAAPNATDNKLAAELAPRKALDIAPALTTVNVANDAVLYRCTFLPGEATGPLVEAALYHAAAGNTACNRVVFPLITKGTLDTLEIGWKVYMEP
jgi:hypothetical protein